MSSILAYTVHKALNIDTSTTFIDVTFGDASQKETSFTVSKNTLLLLAVVWMSSIAFRVGVVCDSDILQLCRH